MKKLLTKLLDKSYSPYSKFKVAAIIETKDNELFSGVNIENASYGATVCAERTAIFNAITNGYKKGDLKKIYLTANSEKEVFPCFICRQVFTEFFEMDAELITITNGIEKTYKMEDLLPHAFSEEDLI